MSSMTVVRTSAIAALLGFACLLPATAHAQADAMPDSFAFSAEEVASAQSVTKATKADFEGKVFLPYDFKCGNKDLKAGQYVLAVKSEGTARVLTIRGGGEKVNIHVHAVPANRDGKHSALLVRKSGDGRRVEALYVEGLNAVLYLSAVASGSHVEMERVPIS